MKVRLSILCMIGVLLACTGCAGSAGKSSDSTLTGDPAGVQNDSDLFSNPENLGFQIIQGEDGKGIDQFSDLKIPLGKKTEWDDYTFDKNQILIHSKLYLSDHTSQHLFKKTELFFVWPDQLGRTEITSALYSHRSMNQKGEWSGTLESKMAWHDLKNRRWFIPLREIIPRGLKNEPTQTSFEDMQSVDLELTLDHRRHGVIHLNFQASEHFPDHFPVVNIPMEFSTEKLIRGISQHGEVIQREEITNPVSTQVNLWVRHSLKTALKLHSHIQKSEYQAQSHAPPVGPILSHYVSSVDLSIHTLEVVRAGEKSEFLELGPGVWGKIPLNPGENVSLKWRASPIENANLCLLPPLEVQRLSWTTFEWVNVVFGVGEFSGFREVVTPTGEVAVAPSKEVGHAVSQNRVWSFIGAQVQGEWSREMRFTNLPDQVPKTEKQKKLVEKLVSKDFPGFATISDELDLDIRVGNTDGPRSDFTCHGIFK